MKNNSCAFVNLASFTDRMQAHALRSVLQRQWVQARLVGEGIWGRHLFANPSEARVHVQVPEECYDEARRYLISPEQTPAQIDKL